MPHSGMTHFIQNQQHRIIIGWFTDRLDPHFKTMVNPNGDALLALKGGFSVHIHHMPTNEYGLHVSVGLDLRNAMIRGRNEPICEHQELLTRAYDIRDPAFNPQEIVNSILKICVHEAKVQYS